MAAASALHHRVLVLGRGSKCASRVALGGLGLQDTSFLYTSTSPLRPKPILTMASRDAPCRWIVMGFIRRLLAQKAAPKVDLNTLPPGSWILGHDNASLTGTTFAIDTGFNMARSQPLDHQREAFREATFQLPYEIARLNNDAPEFKLEDMGTVPPIPEEWRAYVPESVFALEPVFDPQADARVFLYFPDGTTKATVAFVAINTELGVPPITSKDGMNVVSSTDHSGLFKQALNSWTTWYLVTATEKSDVLEQIEPGKLPVIFLFREKAATCVFDTESQTFQNLDSMLLILGFGGPDANRS
ncbi:hypothetical protein M406DRAFT_327556 [Cryphonectria parasitica EP155]|uniref:Uncharacterized protein n=1 Tax=Cryphonectria parasitica (strain ATCC 38755 / EP155) TaxID=660469 RepID=A0A9P4Y993_CRYP1|nr:uncharacterized protein M406DRAFT_327556 [Cryphonectria parasitica EP155]KAF3769153.1 hypothetical protein M406DRAFT_327556 [Cryphonectria parasitica EP155]